MKQRAVCMQVGQFPSNTKACDQTVSGFLIGRYLSHSGKNVQINRAWKKVGFININIY